MEAQRRRRSTGPAEAQGSHNREMPKPCDSRNEVDFARRLGNGPYRGTDLERASMAAEWQQVQGIVNSGLVTRCRGADCRGDRASPVGRGVQTEQQGEMSLWEDEMAGVDWRRRQLRIAQAQRGKKLAGQGEGKHSHVCFAEPGWAPPVRGCSLGADKLYRHPDTDGWNGSGYSIGHLPPIPLSPRASNRPGTRLSRRENSTFPASDPAKLYSAVRSLSSGPLNSTNSTNFKSWLCALPGTEKTWILSHADQSEPLVSAVLTLVSLT